MRVILDECLPRHLGKELTGHTVTTVPRAGWGGVMNGKLLELIKGKFDALITVDKNLPKEHEIGSLSFGVLILRAASNDIDDLKPLVPQVLAALTSLQPGEAVAVSALGSERA